MATFSWRSFLYTETKAGLLFLKRFAHVIFMLVFTGVCLFAGAGRIDWPNGWALLALSFAVSLMTVAALWGDPELVAERGNRHPPKDWDKALIGITVLFGPMATWITAGLDVRYHWSDGIAQPASFAGAALALLGGALVAWSMHSNRYFSSVVRIQKDRGHTVMSGGPYSSVRHPGYTGMSLFMMVTPLILNSRWAFVPATMTTAASLIRTELEDRTLRSELPGYAEYASRVRYRLIPAIW